MAPSAQRPELLVIVGPTASGKSDLALKVAKQFDGEIIAADSRTIYIGMDVGTAKPSEEEQKLVPHWGLDLVEPGQAFSAYRFKKYAQSKIKDIQKRGKLPILVGGTGLYIDSVLFDFGFVDVSEGSQRQELEKLSIERLQNLIKDKKYPMPQNSSNRRHLIRTIERKGQTGSKSSIKNNVLLVGLMPDEQTLKKRIAQRAEMIFQSGVTEETERLMNKYGEEAVMKTAGIVYKICIKIIKDEITSQRGLELFKAADWQYVRRQRTWFKRNKFIRWHEV